MNKRKPIAEILIVIIISILQILLIHIVSDLPIGITNWIPKARELANLHFPSSNFYPPGSAILLLPFLYLTSKPLIILIIYYILGNYYFFQNSFVIKRRKFRLVALSAILFNPYLPWLIYSSQDTIFEYFLLMISINFLLRQKFIPFLFFGFILNLCRPAYWVFYLLIGIVYFTFYYFSKNRIRLRYLAPLLFLILNLAYNYNLYNSFRLADESGITSYFSYNKDLYLALPLFDMDVFLSKGGHMTNPYNLGDSPSAYSRAAIRSLIENPKEALLASMQKIDSYIFTSQKVPKLSGEYYLSENRKYIVIGNERITWLLVIGNLGYQIYRGSLFVVFLLSLGSLIGHYSKIWIKDNANTLIVLIVPWIAGFISCTLFYTETRFKIVPETLLFIFSMKVFSELSLVKEGDLKLKSSN